MSVRNAGGEEVSGQPLTMLFWLGAGLALVAALILLAVPGNTALRIGAVLGLLAVVLIGLSRPRRGRQTATETGAVMQATFQVLDEKLRALEVEVRTLRADVTRIAAARGGARSPAAGMADAAYRPDAGAVRGSYASASSAGYAGHMSEPEFAGARHDVGRPGMASVPQPGRDRPGSGGRAPVPSPAGRHPVATGVVRHTETVRVMTRQTIVEPDADRQENVYGSVYAAAGAGRTAPRQRSRGSAEPEPDWPPADAQRGWADDDSDPEPLEARPEREWSAGRSRAARARSRHEADPAAAESVGHPQTTERGNGSWRADERWASVRDDADGREVRVGRRRAAVRADDTGTEMRVEDRWAAVRQAYSQGERWAGGGDAGEWADGGNAGEWADGGDAGEWADSGDVGKRWAGARQGTDRSGGRRRRSTGGAEADWNDHDLSARWDERSSADQPALGDDGARADRPSTGRVWRPRVPAALPAGGSAGSWRRDGWAEPEREPERSPRAGSRQVGFERSDARWG